MSVSYQTFTRFRPFWVLKQSDVERDTCLCKKHENIEFKAKKLKQIKVLSDDNPHDLCKFIACDKNSAKCMYSKCTKCKDNIIPMSNNGVDVESTVSWKIVKRKSEKRRKSHGRK